VVGPSNAIVKKGCAPSDSIGASRGRIARGAVFALVSAAALTLGCKNDAMSSRGAAAQKSASPAAASGSATFPAARDEVHGGIRFLVLFRGGADDHAPLIVGMHGRGGSPERFSRVLQDYEGRVEIALAQAPTRYGDGWSWLPGTHDLNDSQFVVAFDNAEKQLWQGISELAAGRRVFVTGFSQGGMLSYALAARHPREIAYAFPISGAAPPQFFPRNHEPAAPVYALHGSSDEMIEVQLARDTVGAFRAEGAKAELHEFAGVGHDMPREVREDLLSHLRTAVEAEADH
jgi:phospholipase/carboxylesterase